MLHPEGIIRKASGGYVYYYAKKDHMNSTRVLAYEANGVMRAAQTTDYYPFGMSFRSSNTNYNRYLYSGKELQDQTINGAKLMLYDFGARNYDPMLGRWFNIDPHANKYYSTSPYVYCLNTPINAIDPDGKLVIFVNGMHNGFEANERYWGEFDNAVMRHVNDNNARYYDGSMGGIFGISQYKSDGLRDTNLSLLSRYRDGYNTGKRDAFSLVSGLSDGETIKVITHSMGAAYAKGLIRGMIDGGVNPSLFAFEADFAPFEPGSQKAVDGVKTYQYSHSRDLFAGDDKMTGAEFMDTSSDTNQGHNIDSFWNKIESLPPGVYGVEDGEIVRKLN